MSLPDDAMTRRFPADLQQAQRNLDRDMIKTLRSMSAWASKRSAKLALMLKLAANRVEQLGAEVDQLRHPAPQPTENQPASTPIN